MDFIYQQAVQKNDEYTASTLGKQVLDPASKYYGGVIGETGVARPTHVGTPRVMGGWASALVNPDSRYYHDEALLAALDQAADFMLNRQHADGTISLGGTNFHSPPDTAFVVGGLAQMVQLLEAHDWAPVEPVAAKLRLFLERTIPAMLTGGCHTPNHRWVITAALALLHELFGKPELVARAEEWLAEGIDITGDGEWTERSNGIYNAVSNIALYHTARLLNRPELLEHVRRNLRMMAYLVHPNGEIVTDYSGRQDFGKTYDMATYFLVYRLMAAHDRDPFFAAMSDYSGSYFKQPEAVNNNALMGLLLYPEAHIEGLERLPLPDRYVRILNARHPMGEHLAQIDAVGHHMKIQHSSMHLAFGAPVVRIREQDTSVTVMTHAPSFFSLRHGKVRLLGVKLSTSFSPGIVKFSSLTVDEETGAYQLKAHLEKGYNGPVQSQLLPELAGRAELSPWYLLPHQHRPMTHLQTQELQVDITPHDSEWTIRVRTDEREDVYAQLTFILGAEGEISGSDVLPVGDGRHMLKSGAVKYSVDGGGEAIEISSGAHEHWVSVLNEDQHPAGCQYVHVNLLTPFDRTFTIRLL
ncbi:hypothetical protein [Paenibacillus cremeus]|uniref:Uncharacterized protein n=1 Tax=Paenibacillus cremeus TaxID=2163881 RepID=A0A559K4H0_9BACL|nr:hypothetical protein [Paenibacillus cremeus]TVY06990.1 hypothetical protein FPZ49_26520 [Paenibacillus cremeus]